MSAPKLRQRRGVPGRFLGFRLAVVLMVSSALLSVSLVAGQERRRRNAAGGRTRTRAEHRVTQERSEGGQAEVHEDGQSKVKVFRFSGFDISGRLKSPSLLYFLNRMRTDFERPRLPHRSFMPELQRSTKGKNF